MTPFTRVDLVKSMVLMPALDGSKGMQRMSTLQRVFPQSVTNA